MVGRSQNQTIILFTIKTIYDLSLRKERCQGEISFDCLIAAAFPVSVFPLGPQEVIPRYGEEPRGQGPGCSLDIGPCAAPARVRQISVRTLKGVEL